MFGTVSMDNVANFAKQLQLEGFDATAHNICGPEGLQVGLRVGPQWLNEKRMRGTDVGFFFPFWELNESTNRLLVASRKFREIVERRAADWKLHPPR